MEADLYLLYGPVSEQAVGMALKLHLCVGLGFQQLSCALRLSGALEVVFTNPLKARLEDCQLPGTEVANRVLEESEPRGMSRAHGTTGQGYG